MKVILFDNSIHDQNTDVNTHHFEISKRDGISGNNFTMKDTAAREELFFAD